MKKITTFLTLAFAVGALTACGTGTSTSDKQSTVPSYQGMTVAREGTNAKSIKNKEGNNGNHYGHDKHDDDIEEEIEDIVTINVKTDDEVKYYVQPEETFIIEVHLSNPSQFEIQSFTLNGKKYANYMFKEGSTMELLLLETTASPASGYVEYTIDAIKYIDGTQIKDVDMSQGDKSIKAGISYTKTPTATLESSEVGTTSTELSIKVVDREELIGDNELSIYLSNGEDVVDQQKLVVGDNKVVFDNLHMSTTYQYGVVGIYDFVDGKDLHPEWLLIDTFTTSSGYALKNVTADKASISFEIEKNDDDATISAIALYDTSIEEKAAESDKLVTSFNDLFSNRVYNLYLDYSYELDGKTINDWVGAEGIKTIAKVAPTLAFKSSSSDNTSVSYEVSVNDADETTSITKVELLKDGVAVKDNGKELKGTFTDLLSNNAYSIRVSYTYDLNDGNGPVADSITKDINTVAKVAPSIEAKRSGEKLNGNSNLEYQLRDNQEEYELTGFGVCMDSQVILGGFYNGKPITRLGFQSLIGCSWFDDAVILDTVKEVGDEVFYGTSINRVIFQSKVPPTFEYNIFGYRSPDVYVPDDAYEAYSNISDSLWIDNIVKKDKLHRFSELGEDYDQFFYGLYDFDVTTTSINASFTLTDSDSLVDKVKVELLNSNKEVIRLIDNASNLNSIVFEELTPMSAYTIRVSCSYDLNEGEGEQILVKEANFETFKYYATFLDQDDNVIYQRYQKDATPDFKGDLPVKESTTSSDFAFWKWETASLEGSNITYSPVFSERTKGLTIQNGSVTKYEGKERNVIIPEYWDGYEVTEIAYCAFKETNIKTVKLPETLTILGPYAFEKCTSLTSINLPDGLKYVYDLPFNCLDSISINVSYDTWIGLQGKKSDITGKVHLFDENGDEVVNVVVQEGQTVGDGAFACCESIQTVTLPSSGLIEIGRRAFYHCKSLTELIIPDGVEIIGEEAFGGCVGLTSIVLPDSVDTLNRAAFADCSHLESVTLSPNVEILPDQLFVNCDALTMVDIPEGVTIIKSRCFDDCGALTSVVIPSTIEQIENQAFTYSWNINKVFCRCSQDVWEGIMANYGHDYDNLYLATPYYYSEEAPTEAGNYWHYVENIPTIWE